MATWFQSEVKYSVQDERGQAQTVTESRLFDAVSYTDAEARIYEYLKDELKEFTISKIVKQKINEVFISEEVFDYWFRCKVSYIVFDEKIQREKKVPYVFLINAGTVKEAYSILESKLGTVQDYIITDVISTKILEVIPYEEPED